MTVLEELGFELTECHSRQGETRKEGGREERDCGRLTSGLPTPHEVTGNLLATQSWSWYCCFIKILLASHPPRTALGVLSKATWDLASHLGFISSLYSSK